MMTPKPARPSPSASAPGIGSFGARYRECQRAGASAPADAVSSTAAAGAAVRALAERVNEGRVNRPLRARELLDLADRVPEVGREGEDLVDRAGLAGRAVVLAALLEAPER